MADELPVTFPESPLREPAGLREKGNEGLLEMWNMMRQAERQFSEFRDLVVGSVNALVGVEGTFSPVPANGATFQFNHNMEKKPTDISMKLICKTADAPYAVNDEVFLPSSRYGTNQGILVFVSAGGAENNTIFGRVASSGVNILNRNSGADFVLTNASWDLVIRAYA